MLTVDPSRATGHLRATFGVDVVRTETTSALVRAAGKVAGVGDGLVYVAAPRRNRCDDPSGY